MGKDRWEIKIRTQDGTEKSAEKNSHRKESRKERGVPRRFANTYSSKLHTNLEKAFLMKLELELRIIQMDSLKSNFSCLARFSFIDWA